ncbi:MAG: 30S ribosomal protein S6 [Candidatus Levybacteria bacterium RIFCSPHIGHO2_02_FULL_37_13]|nr:MAG: 30S ribosomal protein S6 [Candidatus Levybacteria bacterium RIFCSPHIGHO2_02_FULL_37_13]OGH39766.1 MAG: 30S ribosomal protein S6 [Candidatus Levybacteria bacterium RIFCSPLOWO2_01_FULL_37_26]
MRAYELVLVLKTSLSESQQKKILDGVKTLLKGVKKIKENVLGQKPLSYPIKKETAGVYIDWSFEMDSIPTDFEKKLLVNDDVLRHLLIRRK